GAGAAPPALTGFCPSLWSRAMQKDEDRAGQSQKAAERLDEALKKPSAPPKGGKDAKAARLAAALRENLRRRKAVKRTNEETE
ncbi:MAG: hypothetical protein ACOZAA_08920, partial [Pseudomonadota bacterium]